MFKNLCSLLFQERKNILDALKTLLRYFLSTEVRGFSKDGDAIFQRTDWSEGSDVIPVDL